MSGELVLRFLRSSGLEQDVDLFLEAYGAGRGGVIGIMVDGPDLTHAAEAIIPVLKHLRFLKLRPLIVHAPRQASATPSFGDRVSAMIPLKSLEHPLDQPCAALDPKGERTVCLRFVGGPADVAAQAALLARRLEELSVRKLVLLDAAGAVFLHDHPQSIFLVDRDYGPEDFEALGCDPGQLTTAQWAAALARAHDPAGFTISMASPMNLLNELFTVRGAGTLFRPPASFRRMTRVEPADQAGLDRIIEQSFGRRLTSAWSLDGLREVIVETHGRAAAVVLDSPFGRYLSKFAVVRACQGSGFGAELWSELTRDGEPLFWRARPDNPITPWYLRAADGSIRGEQWTFFWIGLPPGLRNRARDYALAQPLDLD